MILQPPSRGRIFISYGRADASALATQLEVELRREGFDVWLDTSQLRGGRSWEAQIEQALHATDVVVALLSPHSTRRNSESGDSVCLDELALARYSQPPTPIVPVLAVADASIPFTVFRLHHLDFVGALFSASVFAQKVQELVVALDAAKAGKVSYRSWTHWLRPGPDFERFLYSKHHHFVGRDWLFSLIHDWLRNTNELALLIKGDPGVGKSSIIAEMAFGRIAASAVITYCCQFDVPETLRPATFVRSVAFQCASSMPAYADAIESPEVRRMLENVEVDPASAFELAVLEPLARLPRPREAAVLLIDALDEAAGFREGPNIVNLLGSRLDRLPPWFRLIATTRHDNTVARALGSVSTTEIHAAGRENRGDLAIYIGERLATPEATSILAAAGVAVTTMEQSLAERCAGSFLYADLFLRAMVRGLIQPGDVDTLPPGLDGIYDRYLRRVFPSDSQRAEVLPILEVLSAVAEPIPLSLAARASNLSERVLAMRIAPLRGLLIESEPLVKDPLLGFWHKSFPDFLTSLENVDSQFAVDRAAGDRRLAALFIALVDAAPDLEQAVAALPPILRRSGLEHLATSGRFFDGLSTEQVRSAVYCASWSEGGVAVGGMPTFAPTFVTAAIDATRFGEMTMLVDALHQAALRHFGASGLLRAESQPNGTYKLAVTALATEQHPLRRALMTTGCAVSVIDQARAQGAPESLVDTLISKVAGLHHLVSGVAHRGWARDLSGYYEDQGYALDIMLSNLKQGGRAKTW
jgi:hypothetical protein